MLWVVHSVLIMLVCMQPAPPPPRSMQAHAAAIKDVAWASGAPLLASSDAMGSVIVWEVGTSRLQGAASGGPLM